MIEERGLKLFIPEEEPTKDSKVFYNPEMILNRDISVGALQLYQKDSDKELRICEPLSASGIRGLRYSEEVEGIKEIYLNDKNPKAVESIEENIRKNGLKEDKFFTYNKDANVLLSENKRRFDFIDIDPFGSPMSFLDSSARSLFREGFVGITATDLGPLCGSYKKVCRRRYASKPLKTPFCHELGIRILLKSIFEAFARYNFAFKPELSFYSRHYYRIFGRAYESKKGTNRTLRKIGFLSYCDSCGYRSLQEKKLEECPNCSERMNYAGPLWTGKIGSTSFCKDLGKVLEKKSFFKASKLVDTLSEEYKVNKPYYDTHNLASLYNKGAPKLDELKQRIRKKGYMVTNTHFSERSLRTKAPVSQISEMI